jgi:3-dehydroshikimate dehydratase
MNDARILSGLVSVTFRKLTAERIVELVAGAGLESIEWGGDIHVPHGDTARATEVGRLTRDAGLRVSAYGSYYRVGGRNEPTFDAVLASAEALEAPTIRVWAGDMGSKDATPDDWARITDDLHAICMRARSSGMTIGLEYHGRTLTDTPHTTLELLNRVDLPNLRTYWQPRNGDTPEQSLEHLDRLRPFLGNLHVFHWSDDARTRHSLATGEERWKRYLAAVTDRPRVASLEFVKDESESLFHEDAQTLKRLLASVHTT